MTTTNKSIDRTLVRAVHGTLIKIKSKHFLSWEHNRNNGNITFHFNPSCKVVILNDTGKIKIDVSGDSKFMPQISEDDFDGTNYDSCVKLVEEIMTQYDDHIQSLQENIPDEIEYGADIRESSIAETTVNPGEKFTKTLTIENTGTQMWPENVMLRSIVDTKISRTIYFLPGESPKPNESREYTFEFTAPTIPGNYSSVYQLQYPVKINRDGSNPTLFGEALVMQALSDEILIELEVVAQEETESLNENNTVHQASTAMPVTNLSPWIFPYLVTKTTDRYIIRISTTSDIMSDDLSFAMSQARAGYWGLNVILNYSAAAQTPRLKYKQNEEIVEQSTSNDKCTISKTFEIPLQYVIRKPSYTKTAGVIKMEFELNDFYSAR